SVVLPRDRGGVSAWRRHDAFVDDCQADGGTVVSRGADMFLQFHVGVGYVEDAWTDGSSVTTGSSRSAAVQTKACGRWFPAWTASPRSLEPSDSADAGLLRLCRYALAQALQVLPGCLEVLDHPTRRQCAVARNDGLGDGHVAAVHVFDEIFCFALTSASYIL